MDRTWYRASLEIRSACLDAGLGLLNVEIADSRGLNPTLGHHISAHEPFRVQRNEMRPRVMALLAPLEWVSTLLLPDKISNIYIGCRML